MGEALTHSLGSREALEGEGVVLGTRGLPQHVDAPLHVELHRERMADAALTAGRRRIPHANPSAACGVHPFPLDDEGKALAADAAATLRGATRAIRRQIWLERRVDSGARQLEEMAMRGGGARAIPEQRLKVRGHALRRRDRVEGKRGVVDRKMGERERIIARGNKVHTCRQLRRGVCAKCGERRGAVRGGRDTEGEACDESAVKVLRLLEPERAHRVGGARLCEPRDTPTRLRILHEARAVQRTPAACVAVTGTLVASKVDDSRLETHAQLVMRRRCLGGEPVVAGRQVGAADEANHPLVTVCVGARISVHVSGEVTAHVLTVLLRLLDHEGERRRGAGAHELEPTIARIRSVATARVEPRVAMGDGSDAHYRHASVRRPHAVVARGARCERPLRARGEDRWRRESGRPVGPVGRGESQADVREGKPCRLDAIARWLKQEGLECPEAADTFTWTRHAAARVAGQAADASLHMAKALPVDVGLGQAVLTESARGVGDARGERAQLLTGECVGERRHPRHIVDAVQRELNLDHTGGQSRRRAQGRRVVLMAHRRLERAGERV